VEYALKISFPKFLIRHRKVEGSESKNIGKHRHPDNIRAKTFQPPDDLDDYVDTLLEKS
jgi:hypothetical protein